MRRTRWKIDIEVGVRPNRVVHQFHKLVFRYLCPSGESESAAGRENTSGFCTGPRWIREVQQRKVRDDAIEAGIGKRKTLRVAPTKLDPRKFFLRDRNHFLRKIETDRNCAAFRGSGRYITWTATNIQDRHLLGNLCEIEQRRNELARRARPNRIVFVRDALPTLVFELGEGVAHRESMKDE